MKKKMLMRTMDEPVLKLRRVSKKYRVGPSEILAVNDVTLEAHRGEIIGLYGPSGSGKTTLLHLIGGLEEPTRGTIIVDSIDLTRQDKQSRAWIRLQKIGIVFQAFNLLSDLTALENVMLPMLLQKQAFKVAENRAKQLLTDVGLEKFGHHLPNQLSGGQQQRVAIARALVNDPLILLADEPTGDLDSSSGRVVVSIFRRLAKKNDKLVLMVTHDPIYLDYFDRVLLLRDGRIIKEGSPQEVLEEMLE